MANAEPGLICCYDLPRCGRSSAGRASPCQGEGRRFEYGRPLHRSPRETGGFFPFCNHVRALAGTSSRSVLAVNRYPQPSSTRSPALLAAQLYSLSGRFEAEGSNRQAATTRKSSEKHPSIANSDTTAPRPRPSRETSRNARVAQYCGRAGAMF